MNIQMLFAPIWPLLEHDVQVSSKQVQINNVSRFLSGSVKYQLCSVAAGRPTPLWEIVIEPLLWISTYMLAAIGFSCKMSQTNWAVIWLHFFMDVTDMCQKVTSFSKAFRAYGAFERFFIFFLFSI